MIFYGSGFGKYDKKEGMSCFPYRSFEKGVASKLSATVLVLLAFSSHPSYSSLALEQACASSFSSAEDIFIGFVKEKSAVSVNPVWETRISKALQKTLWKASQAENWLEEMIQRIGEDNTLALLKTPSYFLTMTYRGFQEKVTLYKEYLGEEGVNHRLQKSLAGFHFGNTQEIKAVVDYLKSYMGGNPEQAEALIHNMIQKNPFPFSIARLSELKSVVEYMEHYMGENPEQARALVRDMIQKNLQPFSSAKLRNLKGVMEYMEYYIGKEQVRKKAQQSFTSLALIKLNQLKKWKEAWGEEEFKRKLKSYTLNRLINQYA